MSKDKVRGHVTLAEDTETPKAVSVMDTGHKVHFQIALLSGNIYRIFTHTLKKKKPKLNNLCQWCQLQNKFQHNS